MKVFVYIIQMVIQIQSFILLAVVVLGIAFLSYSASVIRSATRIGKQAHINRNPPVYSEEQESSIVVRTFLNESTHKMTKPHLRKEQSKILSTVIFYLLFKL